MLLSFVESICLFLLFNCIIESKARDSAKQMLYAINYLQNHNVAHRDLKLENFLYESEDHDSSLKLIDFGFSKVVAPRHTLRASCGSLSYVSPDVLKGCYTPKCGIMILINI